MHPGRSRRFLLLLPLLLLPIGAASRADAATIYTLVDLGTLGGSSSFGNGINDHGHATGYAQTAGGATHAFFWNPIDGMLDLGVMGEAPEQGSFGNAINNSNEIVGMSGAQAFRWKASTGMVLIDLANPGEAADLNNHGTAIGRRIVGGSDRTLIWSATDSITLPTPFTNNQGVAINDLGQYVGRNESISGYFNAGVGSNVSLGSFIPTDLNDNRLIAGYLGTLAALLDYDTNTTTSIGLLNPTDTFSRALGINEAGTVVGVSQGTGAFIFDSTLDTLHDLTALLHGSFADWTILSAQDINNNGQIIATGLYQGNQHAVILNPVPEPSSWLLTLAGALTAAFLLRRPRSSS